MRKALTVTMAILFVFGLLAGPAAGQNGPPPEHPHMLVLHLEFDPDAGGFVYERCVDLAANQPLPLQAHHQNLHMGTAGVALFEAGHAVIPASPLTPWANCDELPEVLLPPS